MLHDVQGNPFDGLGGNPLEGLENALDGLDGKPLDGVGGNPVDDGLGGANGPGDGGGKRCGDCWGVWLNGEPGDCQLWTVPCCCGGVTGG